MTKPRPNLATRLQAGIAVPKLIELMPEYVRPASQRGAHSKAERLYAESRERVAQALEKFTKGNELLLEAIAEIGRLNERHRVDNETITALRDEAEASDEVLARQTKVLMWALGVAQDFLLNTGQAASDVTVNDDGAAVLTYDQWRVTLYACVGPEGIQATTGIAEVDYLDSRFDPREMEVDSHGFTAGGYLMLRGFMNLVELSEHDFQVVPHRLRARFLSPDAQNPEVVTAEKDTTAPTD